MTTIAAKTMIQGRVSGQGDLTVHGRVRGSIVLDGSLLVEPSGIIEATVSVASATISGVFVGDLYATERIDLTETARFVGNLYTPQLRITAGAQLRGRADTVNPLPGEHATAKPAKVTKPKSEPARQPEAPKTEVTAPVRAEAPRVARPEPARPAPRPEPPKPTPRPEQTHRPEPAPRPEPPVEVARIAEPAHRPAEPKPEPVKQPEPPKPEPVRAQVRPPEPSRFQTRPEPARPEPSRPAPRYEPARPAPRPEPPKQEARPEAPKPAPRPEPPKPEPQKEVAKPEPAWAPSARQEPQERDDDSAPRPPSPPRGKRVTLKRR